MPCLSSNVTREYPASLLILHRLLPARCPAPGHPLACNRSRFTHTTCPGRGRPSVCDSHASCFGGRALSRSGLQGSVPAPVELSRRRAPPLLLPTPGSCIAHWHGFGLARGRHGVNKRAAHAHVTVKLQATTMSTEPLLTRPSRCPSRF